MAKDIRSHTHWGSSIVGDIENLRKYDKHIYHLNDHPDFAETVLTNDESWELADLMKSFYILQEAAELFHRGRSNLASKVKVSLKSKRRAKTINEKILPEIFKRIDEILSP